jgi:hypothetical protein
MKDAVRTRQRMLALAPSEDVASQPGLEIAAA